MKTRLPQENIPWQPVLSYKKMQPVNFYSWKKGCISKFKQKRTKDLEEITLNFFREGVDFPKKFGIMTVIDSGRHAA